ncbi:MAG TPA: hypothetical protein VF255_01580 [Solirubrobacterales bacterium]
MSSSSISLEFSMMTESGADSVVAALISAAGVERIIFVDDEFAAGLEDLLEALARLDATERAELLEGDPEEMDVVGLWREQSRELWERLEEDERMALLRRAREQGNAGTNEGREFTKLLRDLTPGVEHLLLSGAEWRDRSEELIEQLSKTSTLLFFDQDFSREEGGSHTEGQKLIKALQDALDGQDKPLVFYGLVTNTVRPGEEPHRREEIIDEMNLDPTRFVLVSRVGLEGEHERLALRLRTMVLTPLFAELLQKVVVMLREAAQGALVRAQELRAEDLEHAVIGSSTKEGVWPAETMLRILQVMQRASVAEAVLDGEIIELTERLRMIVEAGGGSDTAGGDRGGVAESEWAPTAVTIAHDEIYESGEQINRLHLPVALGDLFEGTENNEIYVVVAQPCDLMVRANGCRAPELTHVLLAKLDSDSTDGEGDEQRFEKFMLPYFDREQGGSRYVHLGRTKSVRALVLDSCVYNADGAAQFQLDAELPVLLLPPWRKRREHLEQAVAKILDNVEKLGPNAGRDARTAVAGYFKGDPFAVNILTGTQGTGVEWACKRIGRICDPYARALLARFSQYYARDAYLHDFAA